jgi:hypothetical protein
MTRLRTAYPSMCSRALATVSHDIAAAINAAP